MEQAIDMMFREMDTDHDGKISKSEWMAFQEKQFKMLDKNGDGFITKDEVRAKMREDQERRAMAPK
jgi:Ca2+-binding EF-hand superfamily protein